MSAQFTSTRLVVLNKSTFFLFKYRIQCKAVNLKLQTYNSILFICIDFIRKHNEYFIKKSLYDKTQVVLIFQRQFKLNYFDCQGGPGLNSRIGPNVCMICIYFFMNLSVFDVQYNNKNEQRYQLYNTRSTNCAQLCLGLVVVVCQKSEKKKKKKIFFGLYLSVSPSLSPLMLFPNTPFCYLIMLST